MDKYELGQIINGKITGITKYGIFVKISDEYTGMIHISEISNRFIKELERLYVLDESIEAKIIEIDEEKKQLKLSTKEFSSSNCRKKLIQEQGRGFEPLKEKLDFWVEEKLNDLKKEGKSL